MWVSIWASATALLLPQPRLPVVRAGGISPSAPRVRACAAAGEAGAVEPEVTRDTLTVILALALRNPAPDRTT